MSEETTGVAAIRGMSDLSNSIIMGLNSDMHRIIQRQEILENLIRECNELTKTNTKELMKLSNEIRDMRKLLHDPMVDALTGPLMELQEDSNKRKRERSISRRIYGDSG
jgi:hypothetical protein